MARPGYASVDDYIAAQPEDAQPVLERVRATIRKALPGSEEGISYQIPAFKLDGSVVLYFAGFRRHYSVYPATDRVLDALQKELAGLVHSKATLRFSYDEPVPVRLIARIAKLRAAEVAEAVEAKKARKAKKSRAPARAPAKKPSPRRPSAQARRPSRKRA